uniref:Uncharacterized protein n=1 Tax=Arundo donax TaxID=35708 RepID=A0A0A9BV69_ARUDO
MFTDRESLVLVRWTVLNWNNILNIVPCVPCRMIYLQFQFGPL